VRGTSSPLELAIEKNTMERLSALKKLTPDAETMFDCFSELMLAIPRQRQIPEEDRG
jgi:hypothetical protein